jgi:hypothetical protein
LHKEIASQKDQINKQADIVKACLDAVPHNVLNSPQDFKQRLEEERKLKEAEQRQKAEIMERAAAQAHRSDEEIKKLRNVCSSVAVLFGQRHSALTSMRKLRKE